MPEDQRRPKDKVPDAGNYAPDLMSFGKDLKGVTMGSKYLTKTDRNPGPGYYDADNANSQTKFKSYAATIKEPSGFSRP